jgi:hypothetical protein
MSEREDGVRYDDDDWSPREDEVRPHSDAESEPDEVQRLHAESIEAAIGCTRNSGSVFLPRTRDMNRLRTSLNTTSAMFRKSIGSWRRLSDPAS